MADEMIGDVFSRYDLKSLPFIGRMHTLWKASLMQKDAVAVFLLEREYSTLAAKMGEGYSGEDATDLICGAEQLGNAFLCLRDGKVGEVGAYRENAEDYLCRAWSCTPKWLKDAMPCLKSEIGNVRSHRVYFWEGMYV